MTGPVFIDCSPQMRALLSAERAAIVPGLRIHDGDPAPDALRAVIGDAPAILNGHTKLDATLLHDLPALRLIVFLGSGPASYVDMACAQALGIAVRRVTGYGDTTIAEHAMALMFAVARNVAAHDRDLRDGRWRPYPGRQLSGATLGVIGAGPVGRKMIYLARAIGMRVLYASRRPREDAGDAEHVPLHDLLARSDVVSLHLAQTTETLGYIGREEIAAMKPGSLFINTARGALVDEVALAEALHAGHLAGAGLDVFRHEPLQADAPLLSAPNVVLTPHVAFNTPQASATLLERGLRLLTLSDGAGPQHADGAPVRR